MAIVAHEDCAGHPVEKEEQIVHLRGVLNFLTHSYPLMDITALWVDKKGDVEEISRGSDEEQGGGCAYKGIRDCFKAC